MIYSFYPPSGAAGSNPSVGPNGQPIPGEATLVGGENPSGNLQPLQTDSSGALIITGESGGPPLNVNVADWGGVATSLGQKAMAASVPVAIASDQSAIPNNITEVLGAAISATNPLPSEISFGGAFIDPRQIRPLVSSDVVTVVQPTAANLNATIAPLTNTSVVKAQLQDDAGNGITSQASGGQRALDVGIDVAGVQVDPRQIRALTSADVVTAVQTTGANLHVNVDNFPGTQPISGTVSATQGTTPWVDNLTQVGGAAIALGQTTMSASLPVAIASDQSPIPVSSQASSGALTDGSGSTSATPSTSTQIFAANASRKYFLIQNLSSSNNIYINFTSNAANAPGSITILPFGSFSQEGSFVSTEAINVLATVASVNFTAKQG